MRIQVQIDRSPQVFGDCPGEVTDIYQIRLMQPGGHGIQLDNVMTD
jgi:hypothetical protein